NEVAASLGIEIFADHAAVGDHRAVIEDQGRNLSEGIDALDLGVGLDRARRAGEQGDAVEDSGLVRNHENLAHLRRSGRIIELHFESCSCGYALSRFMSGTAAVRRRPDLYLLYAIHATSATVSIARAIVTGDP